LGQDWLFPGRRAGQPIGDKGLSRRLTKLGIPVRGARNSALLELAREVPPSILAGARWRELDRPRRRPLLTAGGVNNALQHLERRLPPAEQRGVEPRLDKHDVRAAQERVGDLTAPLPRRRP